MSQRQFPSVPDLSHCDSNIHVGNDAVRTGEWKKTQKKQKKEKAHPQVWHSRADRDHSSDE